MLRGSPLSSTPFPGRSAPGDQRGAGFKGPDEPLWQVSPRKRLCWGQTPGQTQARSVALCSPLCSRAGSALPSHKEAFVLLGGGGGGEAGLSSSDAQPAGSWALLCPAGVGTAVAPAFLALTAPIPGDAQASLPACPVPRQRGFWGGEERLPAKGRWHSGLTLGASATLFHPLGFHPLLSSADELSEDAEAHAPSALSNTSDSRP